ncbi:hypothetical protein F5Y02DRAFT_415648 [Annulohypoxylon stygium]|nr:hypothetical protein F5Y02DRAFT_415648 [Annulohypoxylon stygium]
MAYIILSMAFAGFILGFAYGRHVGNQSTLSEEDLEFLHTIEERIMQRGDGLFGDMVEPAWQHEFSKYDLVRYIPYISKGTMAYITIGSDSEWDDHMTQRSLIIKQRYFHATPRFMSASSIFDIVQDEDEAWILKAD